MTIIDFYYAYDSTAIPTIIFFTIATARSQPTKSPSAPVRPKPTNHDRPRLSVIIARSRSVMSNTNNNSSDDCNVKKTNCNSRNRDPTLNTAAPMADSADCLPSSDMANS